MRFNVPCKAFYNAASAVSKVINSKNSLTILDNFRISLQGETLTITGADMDNELNARIQVSDAEGDCTFCVQARRLVDLLKELPDSGITFSLNEDTYEVEIRYTGGKYNLTAMNGAEYPVFRTDDDEAEPISFSLKTESLLQGLEYTIFAVGDDDYRPMMKGIFFDIDEDHITYVATDTHKLVRFIDNRVRPGVKGSCILPVKPATVMRNIFAKEESLSFTMTRKSATVESEGFTFRCSFLNGRFPDYNRVIPKQSPFRLVLDRSAALNAIRRVAVFVDPGYGLEKFKITPDQLNIKSDDNNMCTC
ncbi:MAG: DNA polymerase III subunit beta, partial [Muribaculaceae bacterium]|nr:DNA polymerase III subunit beta [Muribaculaceae bacterium]